MGSSADPSLLFHDLPGQLVAPRRLWAPSESSSYPVRLSWGRYHVSITSDDRGGDDATCLSIMDQHGRIVKQIKTMAIDEVGLIEITGRRPSELYIQSAPMVNIQTLRRAYYFMQSPGVHSLMTTVEMFDAVHRLRNGHVIFAVNSRAPMEGPWDHVSISHSECPATVVVGELRNGRFMLRNRNYPQASLREALSYRREVLKPSEFDTEWMGAAIGYYGNLSMIGRSAEARSWLHRHLSAKRWKDFHVALPKIDEFLRRMPKFVWKNDRRVYTLDESGEYYFP